MADSIRATRRQGYAHDLEIGDHALVVDEPVDRGGTDTGPTPTQLMAGSLAACTAITIEMYADRKGWELGELSVEVEAGGSLVKGDASYEVILHLPGGLSEEQTQRISAIAAKCPVHKALSREIPVSVSSRAGT